MNDTGTVTVYAFRVFDGHSELTRVAPFKATRQVIERSDGAELIEGTGEAVEPDHLDADGHYRRLPTGWGTLD